MELEENLREEILSTLTSKKIAKNLIENLEDLDDIQKVHANFEIPDEQIATMETQKKFGS